MRLYGLIYLGTVFILLFVGQTVNRLPRDILILREHFQDKNWVEFYVQFVVVGFFWLGSIVLVVLFLGPLIGLEIKGWSGIIELVRNMGR